MEFYVSASTDVGLSKDINQDSCCVRVFDTQCGKIVMAVMCDGVGGLARGELASATVMNAFNNWAMGQLPYMCNSAPETWNMSYEWNNLIYFCNEKIKDYGRANGIRLGTTVTATLITESVYFVAHVGDSRMYEIQDYLVQLTHDQTVVAEGVRLGLMTEEQAEVDPRRSVLLQCIGASENVAPEFIVGRTKRDCVYMLCCDGFRHVITPQEMYASLNPRMLDSVESMKDQVEYLIELNKYRQETDNISAITVRTF